MSIFFNNSRINDWNYGASNLIKVYRNGAVCYYKVTGGGDVPTAQTPCYAVVDDISQYSETEFEDVFNKADGKWYKLNNLDEYEEYGIYGSGRTECESTPSSRLPQGYTEIEYIRHSNDVRVQNVWTVPNDAVDGNIYTVDLLLDSTSQQNVSRFIGLFGWGSGYVQRTNRSAGDETNAGYHCSDGWHSDSTIGNYYQEYDVKLRYRMTTSALTITNTETSAVTTINFSVSTGSATGGNFGVFSYTGTDSGAYQMRGNIYQIIIEGSDNTIKHQYIPCQRDSDSKYGLYDLIGEEFYYPTTITISGGSAVTPTSCVTTYDGKLTVDTETPPSRLPQGYTEVEYIENTSTAYINTEVLLYDSTTNSYNIQCKCYFQPYGNDFEYLFGTEGTSSPYVGVCFRYYQRNIQYVSSPDNVSWTHIDNGDGTSGITASCSSTTATNGNNPLTLFCGLWSTGPWRNGRGKIYSFKVTKNDTLVRDLVPCKRDSDNKYGMYDIVNDVFYLSPNNVDFSGVEPIAPTKTYEYMYSGGSWVNVGEVSGSSYPMYYTAKSDPPDNLVFSSMTEAESYECPWVGMKATIDGTNYIFSGDSISGYEWVEQSSRLPSGYTEVEYIEQTSQNVHTYADSAFTIPLNSVFGDIVSTKISLDSSQNNVSRYITIFGSHLGLALRQDSGYRYNLNTSYAGKSNYSNNYTMVYDTPLIYKVSPSNIKITNTVTSQEETITFNGTSNTAQTQTSSAIFGLNFTDSGSYMALGKCYWFKLEDSNGNIKYEYIPCIRDNDNKVGMYDIINRQFVYSTYLTLVAGPTV